MSPETAEATEQTEKILIRDEDGNEREMTVKDLNKEISDRISFNEMTLSVGETRQKRQYEPNNYHVSMKASLDGVDEMMRNLTGDEETIRRGKTAIVKAIVGRVGARFDFMKTVLHSEQEKDGITTIDPRS